MTLLIDFPGVQIIDDTQPTNLIRPYGVVFMLGSANQGNIKEPILVTSTEQFIETFGADSNSEKYIKSWFANLTNNSVRLYFVRVNGVDLNNDPLPATAADYVNTIEDELKTDFNPGGLIVASEAFELMDANDRLNIASAMREFCSYENNDSLWFGIVDTSPTNTSITDVIADRITNLQASKGQLFTYSPYYYNASEDLLVPSTAMAAIISSTWANRRYNQPPAYSQNNQIYIRDFVQPGFTITKSGRSLAHSNNINLIIDLNDQWVPIDILTLSPTKEYYQIPSVVCFRVVSFLVKSELNKFVNFPLSGNVDLAAVVTGALNRVLYAALNAGLLVRRDGRPVSDAYRVNIPFDNLPDPDNAVLPVYIDVRLSYGLQKIVGYIRSVVGNDEMTTI